jgi:hypothetical protein
MCVSSWIRNFENSATYAPCCSQQLPIAPRTALLPAKRSVGTVIVLVLVAPAGCQNRKQLLRASVNTRIALPWAADKRVRMGALISRFTGSRVGSSSFYEQYERNFEGLKEYIIKLKVQRVALKSQGADGTRSRCMMFVMTKASQNHSETSSHL